MGNLLLWSSMVLHARSQYLASDLNNLTESKPDVNFHFQLGTHFWIVVPKIDPEKFDPRDYEDIENTVKSQARFRHAEDMNQFRSCKEHADINDEQCWCVWYLCIVYLCIIVYCAAFQILSPG